VGGSVGDAECYVESVAGRAIRVWVP
jgi:hypothetical protein